MLHASHAIGVLLLKQSCTFFAACHSSAASRPYHILMNADVVNGFIMQRNSSSSARLGFCLLKGNQSNTGATKATHFRHFSFTPLDTPYGQFRMEVDYAPAAAVNFLEQSTSPKHQPEIISDYVRGEQPADKQQMAHTALRGGLTASLQASQRPSSLLNPAAAGTCRPRTTPCKYPYCSCACKLPTAAAWSICVHCVLIFNRGGRATCAPK